MTREPVSSSNLAAVGYCPETLVLEVEFRPARDGVAKVWAYENVDPQVAEQLRGAESIGRAFQIVRNVYRGRHVAIIAPDGVEHRLDEASA